MTNLEIILKEHMKWLKDRSEGKRADLSGADLSGADLSNAYLRCVDLSRADLSNADLRDADLIGADLRGACLRNVDLRNANLMGARLSGVIDIDTVLKTIRTSYIYLQCPAKGSFTAYKKLDNDIIAQLKIPAKAKRSSATSRKCRASEAKVIKMWNMETGEEVLKAHSQRDENFIYEKGKTVKPTEKFDEDRWNECSTGIHFFITLEEAEVY